MLEKLSARITAPRLLYYFLLLAAVVGTFSCSSPKEAEEGGPISLSLNFKPGEKYLYTTEVQQNINSFGMQMQQSMQMEMVYELKEVDGHHKKLEITYDHISMKMGNSEYDSRKSTASDSEMNFVRNMIGKSFSITIAPDGDIIDIEGLDDLIQSLVGSNSISRAEIESQFSDTAIRLMMQNSFDLYPGKEVTKGEQWVKKSQMAFSGITVNVENTYTLDSVKSGKAYIGVSSVMSLPLTRMEVQQGAMAMDIEMNGNQVGSLEVDVETGQVISGKTKQDINGNVKISGQDMPLKIDGDILISSKKI